MTPTDKYGSMQQWVRFEHPDIADEVYRLWLIAPHSYQQVIQERYPKVWVEWRMRQ